VIGSIGRFSPGLVGGHRIADGGFTTEQVLGMLDIVIVCSCHGVNDATIRNTVLSGASCPEQVGRLCGAGTDCGSCVRLVEDLIDEHHEQQVAIVAGGSTAAA
jgi:bacterioferritin-associated ferredoxin